MQVKTSLCTEECKLLDYAENTIPESKQEKWNNVMVTLVSFHTMGRSHILNAMTLNSNGSKHTSPFPHQNIASAYDPNVKSKTCTSRVAQRGISNKQGNLPFPLSAFTQCD